MKQVFLYFLFFIFSFKIGFSQRPNGNINFKTNIDSIENSLKKQTIEDTNTVKLLNDLARNCFLDLQYKKGLLATKKARLLAQKLNYTLGEGHYLRTMFVFLRHYLENFDYRAKWFFQEQNYNENRNGFRIKPTFNLERSQLEIETKQLFEALAFFEKSDDQEFTSNILLALTGNYISKNDITKALGSLEKGILLSEKMKDKVQRFLFLIYKLYALEQTGSQIEAKNLEIEINLLIAKSTDNKEIAIMTQAMSQKYSAQNRRALAIDYHLKSIAALEKIGDKETVISLLRQLANEYQNQGLTRRSAECFLKIIKLKKEINDTENVEFPYNMAAFRYIELGEFETAKKYLSTAILLADKNNNTQGKAQYNDATGQLLMGQKKFQEAIPFFHTAIKYFEQAGSNNLFYYVYQSLAICYSQLNNLPEAINYGTKCYEKASSLRDLQIKQKVSLLLSETYDKLGQKTEAYKYLKEYKELTLKKEKENVANELADIEIKSIVQNAELEKSNAANKSEFLQKLIGYFSLALMIALIILYFLNRNFKSKKKANELLESTLEKLKATQSQLIHSEKLASLGELTAGIAHEIQNPLNFVNNFSEVSAELVTEMKEEIAKGNMQVANEIADDLTQNLEKITLHGKRASSIVKGMLDHSKTSSGQKELTDLNNLADECLRLSYHGLRAKDKSFNANFKTDLDPNLPKIEVIPQDLGRVFLNLINNAFQAPPAPDRGAKLVVLKTLLVPEMYSPIGGRGAIISVKDNGSGMSPETKAKIFQPFFTTKPTGEGTGLGLSLAYDIITQGHGGTIECESVVGEGTTFIVKLPIV